MTIGRNNVFLSVGFQNTVEETVVNLQKKKKKMSNLSTEDVILNFK